MIITRGSVGEPPTKPTALMLVLGLCAQRGGVRILLFLALYRHVPAAAALEERVVSKVGISVKSANSNAPPQRLRREGNSGPVVEGEGPPEVVP
eukprot:scaffold42954_cov74-Phaeocystis_antarctica.AAC.8